MSAVPSNDVPRFPALLQISARLHQFAATVRWLSIVVLVVCLAGSLLLGLGLSQMPGALPFPFVLIAGAITGFTFLAYGYLIALLVSGVAELIQVAIAIELNQRIAMERQR